MALQIVKPLTYTERTLTRASTGNYFDTADGLLKSAAIDIPRFDKHEGFLSEAAATNLLLYSQDTSQSAWVKGTSTAAAPQVLDPAGGTTAYTITSSAGIGVYQVVTTVASTVYSFSVMLKPNTALAFTIGQNSGTVNTVDFDTVTQTFSNPVNVISYRYKTLESGWYLVEVVFTASSTSSQMQVFPLTSGSTLFYLWGCQLEAFTKSTSYILTTAATANRSADVVSTNGYISDVVEGTTAAYNGGTTYAAGDLVYVPVTSSTYKVYKSLVGSNTGNAPASSPAFWSVQAQTDYPIYSAVTAYTVGQRVLVLSTHMVYECVLNSTGNDPTLVSSTFWKAVSATNEWSQFDTVITTQTAKSTKLSFSLRSSGITNLIGFVNLKGNSIRVRVRDATEGIVYDKTVSLTGSLTLPDWYAYFFSTGIPSTQAVFTDLPPYIGGTITVDIVGDTCAVGATIAGYGITFGLGVQYGANVGIQDYSRKERDAYGEVIFVQRSFAKRVSMNMLLNNSEVDAVLDALADLRAVPCLWIGSKDFNSTIVYGFYRDFNISISYPSASECSIEVEGLV